jgi:hypothetical protein
MLLTSIASLAGILGLILTLLFMARQTRKLTEQTMTGNAIAHLDAHYNALERLHDLNKILLEMPNLQPYFLLGKECQPGDPDYDSIRLLGEMFADVFDLGLELHRRIKDEVHRDCWDATVIEAIKQPILRQAITSDAPWWPDLRMFVQQRPELFAPSPGSGLLASASANPATPAPQQETGHVVKARYAVFEKATALLRRQTRLSYPYCVSV